MDTNTGGGSNIAGNASVERDFIGRDQSGSAGQSVHIAMERMAEVSQLETDMFRELSQQIAALTAQVNALTIALVGDNQFGSTGLVQRVKEMDRTNRSREMWRIVSTWMLVLLLLSQVIQGWWIYQVYALYWAIYLAVQAVQ